MNFSEIAVIADLIAAGAIVVTLAALAYEMHKNARQMKITNWHATMQSIKETRRRTDNPHVADVITRGGADFFALSDAEQLTFGNFIQEQLLDYDPFIVHSDEVAVSREHTLRAVRLAYRDFLASPGARQWWHQSDVKKRWPPHLTSAVNEAVEAIEQSEKERG